MPKLQLRYSDATPTGPAPGSLLPGEPAVYSSAGLTAVWVGDDNGDPVKVFESGLYAEVNAPLTPMMPQIETASRHFTLTQDGTDFTVDAGQTWLWRGTRQLSTDGLFSAAERTVTVAAGVAGLLYWDAPGYGAASPKASYPNGTFWLLDATADFDGGTEDKVANDGNYDRMLIAEIDNRTGTPAVAEIINSSEPMTLEVLQDGLAPQATPTPQTGQLSLALARTPAAILPSGLTEVEVSDLTESGDFAAGDGHDHDFRLQITGSSRSSVGWSVYRDYATKLRFSVLVLP